jgi:S-adenosylmethionine synthetase
MSEHLNHSMTTDTIELVSCVGCGDPMYVAKGTIQYYHKECRKKYKSRYQHVIHSQLAKKRPWYFWLWLWVKRMMRRL